MGEYIKVSVMSRKLFKFIRAGGIEKDCEYIYG